MERLEKEMEHYLSEFMILYSKTLDELRDGEKAENLELNNTSDDLIIVTKSYEIVDFEINGVLEEKDHKIHEEPEPEHVMKKEELEHLGTKLESRIKELTGRIDVMFNANAIVVKNVDTLKQDNFSLKEQNKNLIDQHEKIKAEHTLKIQSLESIIESLLLCDKCGKTFKDKTAMKEHIMSSHSTKKFECSICGKGITTVNGLKKHVKCKHGDEKKEIY